jgi:nucleotide-binding universal stress UspA family protein
VNRLEPSQPVSWENRLAESVRIERILVPVDFSACSVEALRHASAFAKQFEAVIDVVHVVQLNIAGEEAGVPRTALIRQLSEAARQSLSKLIEVLWAGEIMATVAIQEGRPADVIVEEARARNSDLIIIGTQEKQGLLRLLGRNTAARVIRRAPCPVLVVPIATGRVRHSDVLKPNLALNRIH